MVWVIGGLLLLALILVLIAAGVFGSSERGPELVAVLPLGGRGDRADILDRVGNWRGYGIRRSDGSWDFFDKDNSKMDLIPAPHGSTTPGHEAMRIILQPRPEK